MRHAVLIPQRQHSEWSALSDNIPIGCRRLLKSDEKYSPTSHHLTLSVAIPFPSCGMDCGRCERRQNALPLRAAKNCRPAALGARHHYLSEVSVEHRPADTTQRGFLTLASERTSLSSKNGRCADAYYSSWEEGPRWDISRWLARLRIIKPTCLRIPISW